MLKAKTVQLLVLAAGLGLSALLSWKLQHDQELYIDARFQHESQLQAEALHREIQVSLESLYSLSALLTDKSAPSRAEFHFTARQVINRHPGVQALEWIPRVKLAKKSDLEEQQKQRYPGFTFTELDKNNNLQPVEERPEYFPVYFVEPLIGNENAFGFDLASNPVRLSALNNARDNASPSASAPLSLVQGNSQSSGILAFLPHYQGMPVTLDARRENLQGFVLGVFYIDEIFDISSMPSIASNIQFRLTDITTEPEEAPFFISQPLAPYTLADDYSKTQLLPLIWGRQWVIESIPTQGYIDSKQAPYAGIILLVGITFTLLTNLYIYLLSKRTRLIEREVKSRTAELNEMNRKLQQIARIDELTSLYNRRGFEEFYAREWQRAVRNKTTISVIIFDVDHFKRFNDKYGHLAGDHCLEAVASILSRHAKRPGDLVARLGGEEFVVLLTDTENPQTVAEDCRHGVACMKLRHEDSPVADIVTISAGFTSISPEAGIPRDLALEQADKALYMAKESGRNRVIRYHNEHQPVTRIISNPGIQD
ncbi:diguanylate cyclase [Shewanella submarina]|uniref:diguanylate cyclase n=1 Tax=Shewanella submarina TaxID=2016376 RepID=A0ABV7GBU7_9GAMM|nr:diguanylate cyclase [Shewanella submarina]MCL1036754.1 diguanylate cyclase [Shewanella submarina]